MTDKKIVLFDGVCTFCNFWVRFIFKRNKEKDIYFIPLQDERAKTLLPDDIRLGELASVIYYRQGEIFTHSTAALKICSELNLFYRILSNLLLLIPKRLRDGIYNFIGKRRYKWFGKKDDCPIPPPDLRKQFL